MLPTPAGGRPGGFALATGSKKLYASPKWVNRANDFLKDASNPPLPSAPPCIRHLRRPVTGADLRGAPNLVRAPQRLGCDPGPVSVRRMGLSAAASGLRADL